MKTSIFLAASTVALIAVGAVAAPMIPSYIAAAVADSHRPDTDTARDVNRKPAEILAFSEVKPGDKAAAKADATKTRIRVSAMELYCQRPIEDSQSES